MKCLNCNKIINGSTQKKFCSDGCRKAYSRKNSDKNSDKIEKSDTKELGQPEIEKKSDISYRIIEGKVYGRQAVIFSDEEEGITNPSGAFWKTRPEPENPDDIPDKNNRAFYKRKDGSEYHFDVCGSMF